MASTKGGTRPFVLVALMALLTTLAAAPAFAKNQVERPYTAREDGTAAIDPACEDFFAGCDLETTSSGTTTHLGKTSVVSSGTIRLVSDFGACTLLDGETPGLVFQSEGTFIVTAANRDQLHGTFENEGCTNPFADPSIGTEIVGSQVITGGTGRFAGASGSTTTFGHGFGDIFDLVATGTLTY